MLLHVVLCEHIHNRITKSHIRVRRSATMLVGAHENRSCAKVMLCDLVNRFTLSPLLNHSQAEYIVTPGNSVNPELDKVNVFATQFTFDVAIQWKTPPGNDDEDSVERYPHGSKGNAHNVAFGEDLTAKHNEVKEAEIVRILGIVVLTHKI